MANAPLTPAATPPYFLTVAERARQATDPRRRPENRSAATGDAAALGAQLRELRLARKWTLKSLAAKSGVAIGYLSEIERGQSNITLSVLKRVCGALETTVGALLEDGQRRSTPSSVTVLRRGQRKKVVLPGIGIANELISPDLQKQMEIIWVEAEPGADSGGHPHQHEGEECGVIFRGAMEFEVDGQTWMLEPGDSIYLASTHPHRWRSCGKERLEAIWIITPPTF